MISATIRDIAIIIIAIQSIVIGTLLGVLVWQVWRLVRMLQTEIQPILRETQGTIHTVRGTTGFVSDNVISPVLKANRTIARMGGTARSLAAGIRRSEQTK